MSGPKGIDFYYGDGTPSVAAQSFDVIKASEGTSFPPDGPIPDWYASEQSTIRASGALFGAYLFWHPSADNAAQLANFQRRANVRPGDVIQLDCEVTDGLDWTTVNTRKNDMLRQLKLAYPQCRVLLYTYLDFWHHLDGYAADGLWIADPNSPPGQPQVGSWVIHQYASSGVDYDIANFPDAAALRAWAAALDPAPIPTPMEDDMSTTSNAQGRAGLSWAAGAKHVIQVTYDPAGGDPHLRVVLALATGPWVAPDAWQLSKGSGTFRIPDQYIASCRGVVLEGAATPVYDATAV